MSMKIYHDGLPNVYAQANKAVTNLALWSSGFDNSVWAKTGSVVSSDVEVSPTGVLDGDLLSYTTAGSRAVQQIIAIADDYTMSVYLKDDSKSGTKFRIYNLTTGGIVKEKTIADITSGEFINTGWYRNNITVLQSDGIGYVEGDALWFYIYTDSSGGAIADSSLYIWGAQVETGISVNNYIPTTTAAASILALDYTYPAANIDPSDAKIGLKIDYEGDDVVVMDIGGVSLLSITTGVLKLSDGTNELTQAITEGSNTVYATLTADEMKLDLNGAVISGPYTPIPAGLITVSEDHYALHANPLL